MLMFTLSCSLEGDINSQRNNSGSNSSPSITAPGTPVVAALDGLLTVSWTAVNGAENYEVYISTSQTPPSLPEKTVSITTTVLDGLINKTVYYVWIKARNNSEYSDFSPRARGIPWPENEIPAAPERPVIIPGINQLTVNWEQTGGAVYYEVYINTSTMRPSAPEIINDKTNAVIQNLENDVIYYIWVRAVNSAGKSDYSPLEAGTPRIPTVAPIAPQQPVLIIASRELIVSWQVVELAAAYEVWVGTSDNLADAQKYGGDFAVTETVITGLVNNTTYYVWIRAKNLAGTSGFSPSANAAPSAFSVLPETPAVPQVIIGSGVLDISWQPSDGALFYEVWTGTSDNSVSAEKYGADVTGTSVTLTGLSNGTTYFIWIRGKNNIGTGDFSPMASGTPSAFAAIPSAPQTAPIVSAGNEQLAVSWQAIEGANVYEVWIGTANNSADAVKLADNISALSSIISDLTNETTYYVWIKAKNSIGTSGFSPMASGTPQIFAVPPQTPLLPVINIGNEQLNVSWTAVQGATAYEIWLADENNTTSALKHGADISASVSATISGLDNGTTYFVWLKAKNDSGASDFSPAASGKPIANAPIPSLISGNSQLTVNWTAISGADQYEIFIGTGANPPQNVTQTIDAPLTATIVSGLVNGTNYNVWIRGKNTTGTGLMSNSATAKPIGSIGVVTLSSGNGQISLSWASVAGADEYEVYYDTVNTMPASPVQTVMAANESLNGLVNGTIYYVWVRGKNTSGFTNISAVVSGKPLGTPETPVITSDFRQLTVSWTAVAGADEYEVYYGIGSPATLVTTTENTTAIISDLTGGTTYHVRLRAKNANGVSDYGPIANGEPNDALSPGLYRNDDKVGNQNLAMSLSYISTNAVTGDEFIIVLGGDETIDPTTLGYSGRTVGITLQGYGEERTVSLSSNGSMFTVNAGITLILDENVSLLGRNGNNRSIIMVQSGSILIINDGVKISGNHSISSYGGGITILYSNIMLPRPILIMNGGSISGNSSNGGGGGISVDGGAFTMNGGKITGNSATGTATNTGGGGVRFSSGSFIMYGGVISGNTSARYGGGVYVYNPGNYPTFIMHGGIISGNTASTTGGGVEAFYGTFRKQPLNGQNSGIIYGAEETGVDADGIPLRNYANVRHHVVATGLSRQRNTTAWETDHIDTTTGRGLSSSGNSPFGQ